jgi:hypothetical protein
MTGIFNHQYRRLFISILIILSGSSFAFSQTNLSGNLNQPSTHVSSISGLDRMVVDDITGFKRNDFVLVIQMQGVSILTDASYGQVQAFYGQPGLHEFVIIQAITPGSGTTGEIQFTRNLLKTYDIRGNIQLVRVPSYIRAKVTGTLTCNPWNSTTKSGGVLAMIISKSLTLNADIDVTGKGFNGGADYIGDARCAQVAPVSNGNTYPLSFTNAGLKGEGIANYNEFNVLLSPTNVKGKGPNLSGGGGGNGKFSGGGGGSNMGEGGTGGFESNTCTAAQEGGLGGRQTELPSFPLLADRIYLGGGGGGSTSLTGLSQPGGNGGGIIIIVTDSIVGNSHKIISNGNTGGLAVVNGGSGGGGGGGSIALTLTNYSSAPLGLTVNGGNGGDNPGTFGEGGGGGGGLVYVNTAPTTNVTVSQDGGNPGNILNQPATPALPGQAGVTKTGFKVVLNGFLFNSIWSSVNGDTIDWICSNVMPKLLDGTSPVGGSGSYTYKWQKIYNPAVIADTIDLPSSNTKSFQPVSLESNTVYYRRIVKDNVSSLRDVSKWVKVIVQTAISGNTIGKDTTICAGQNPLLIGSVPKNTPPSNGNGVSYKYKWLQNSTDTGWDTLKLAVAPFTGMNYDPPVLTLNTFYKRYVQSGRCTDFSNTVKVTVLPSLTGNIITRSDSIICQGIAFPTLNASAPGQGDLTYTFQWQDSITTGVWQPAAGLNNTASYSVDTSKFTKAVQTRYFRRTVVSGPLSVCKSRTKTIGLTKYPRLKSNSVIPNLSDTVICSGINPHLITATNPVDGAGTGSYTYIWQTSTNGTTFSPAGGTNNLSSGSYQPLVLTDTTWFRRIVNSGPSVSPAVCTNTSSAIKINVHKPILNNTISLSGGALNQTICNAGTPLALTGTTPTGGTSLPGSYAYLWKFSTDNTTFTAVPSNATLPGYTPAALSATTYYRREVSSGACRVTSNTIPVTVLPSIANNTLAGNPRVCFSRIPELITGGTLTGGSGSYKYTWQQSSNGGVSWIAANGTNTSADYQSPALSDSIRYRRIVVSGLNDCCTDSSGSFKVSIDPLPQSVINAGKDTSIYSVEKIYHMKAVKPAVTGETAVWTVLTGNSKVDDAAINNTTARYLTVGVNEFIWTVTKGVCSVNDSVSITLLKDFIPQGFSPNGDIYNNTFIIEGLNLTDQYVDLRIVNGAGTEVFTSSNHSGQNVSAELWKNWDGRNSSGRDLPEGTYYYMLKVSPLKQGSTVRPKSGFIILKRY